MWYQKSVSETLESLSTSIKGLSADSVADLRLKYGANEIVQTEKIRWYHILFAQFTNIMVVILIAAAVISFAVHEYLDAIAIMIILVINAVIGFVQEYKAEGAIEALKKLTAPEAIVVRGGETVSIPARDLVPGDVILLEEGMYVPADARVIEAFELYTDEASLTGESSIVNKNTDPIDGDVAIGDQLCMVFMGTVVAKGHGKAVVTSTGMETNFGKIAHLVQKEVDQPTPLKEKLNSLTKVLALITIGVVALLFVIAIFTGRDLVEMLVLSISLAVAVIPEGLPAVITLTLAIGVQNIARKNAIIRKLPAAETLGSTSVICSDKTGTLTENQMTVRSIFVDGVEIEVTGTGYHIDGEFMVEGEKIDPLEINGVDKLLKIGLLCNNSRLVEGEKCEVIGDPTEGCLITVARKAGLNDEDIIRDNERSFELVFDSERKMMSTVNNGEMHTKGAVASVLGACDRVLEKGKIVELTSQKRAEILEMDSKFAARALRVLGFAYKNVDSGSDPHEEGLIFVGMMGMMDPPREEVKVAIEKCRSAHIRVVMITGDHASTAKAIGEEIGLFKEGDKVLTGQELEEMNDKDLGAIIEEVSVFARVNPSHKLRILKAIQAKGHIVAMTGDGVNDAPALKGADIGIAMGITGTDVSKEASDMVLVNDDFSTIVVTVEAGRVIYTNIKKFVQFLLSANLGEVLVIAVIFMTGYPLPLIPLQILWINLMTDAFPAIALGVDTADKDIMKLKPRDPNSSIFKELVSFSLISGALVAGISTFIFFNNINSTSIEHVRTAIFTLVVVFELLLVFSVRYNHKHYFTNFFKNKVLILAVIFSLALQMIVVYVPFMQSIFSTVPLSLADWGWIVGLSIGAIALIEIWKLTVKKPDHV